MNPDRWKRVQELFEAAVEMNSLDQEHFLARECSGDDDLYQEVSLLIAADADPHRLLRKSHAEIVGLINQPVQIGQRIAQYEVLDAIASGGMGEIYLAIDTDLKRKVALKFLPSLGTQAERDGARLLQEARTAAALNHPNIVTIYEIVEHNNLPCLIMEYVDGQSLRQLIANGELGSDRMSIISQLCDGLLAAHRAGIVHRDLKPENILVTADGRSKILDFGIARVMSSTKSVRAGQSTGTPAYMSPEQVSGGSFDFRSDIFSLGVVIYEVFAGKNPFLRDTVHETLHAIVNEPHDPIAMSMSGNGQEIQAIVDRCLAKHPEHRYPSIDELARDINAIPIGVSTANSISMPAFTPKIISLAVLHLKMVDSEEDEYLTYGVTEDLIIDLSRIGVIRVLPMRRVLPLKNTGLSIKQIARKLRASHILEGSIQWRDGVLQLSAQIIAAATGEVIFSNRWQARRSNLTDLERQLADGVCRAFNINPSLRSVAQIDKRLAENAEAYEHYLRGRFILKYKKDSADVAVALGLLRRAVELEDGLIVARCGIAEILMLQGEKEQAEKELNQALSISLRDNAPANRAAVLRLLAQSQIQQSRWVEAFQYGEQSLQISRENRDLAGEATTLGVLISALLPQAEYDQALAMFDRVIEIHQSLDNQEELGEAFKNIGTLYRQRGDYTKAEEYYSAALESARRYENLALESASVGNLGTVYHCRHELDRALRSYQEALTIDTRLGNKSAIQAWLPNLAHIWATKGNHRQALSYLERAKALSRELGDFKVYTHILVSSADVSINLGQFQMAAEIATEAVSTAERIGFLPGQCYARHQLGLARFWCGDHTQALAEMDAALSLAHSAQLRRSIAWLLLNLGEFYFYLERYNDAQAAFSRSFTEASQIGETGAVVLASAYLTALDIIDGKAGSRTNLEDQLRSIQPTGEVRARQVIMRLLAQVLMSGSDHSDRKRGAELLQDAMKLAIEREAGTEIAWLKKISV